MLPQTDYWLGIWMLKTACEGSGRSEEHGRENLCCFMEHLYHYKQNISRNRNIKYSSVRSQNVIGK